MLVNIKVDKCTNASCSTVTNKGTKNMTFNLANPTVYWDTPTNVTGSNIPDASGNGGNFFGQTALEVNYGNYGLAIESNSDTGDAWSTSAACVLAGTCNLEQPQPATVDPFGRGTYFSIGDLIPLDWKTNQQTTIQNRMAPNLLGTATVPDFGIANYMADHPLVGESALRLKDKTQVPMVPVGGTPTGHVMADWWTNWLKNWIPIASASTGDPFFTCKPAYVLLVTDGLASSDDGDWTTNKALCPQFSSWTGKATSPTPGYACCVAEALRTTTYGTGGKNAYPVRTYVIGLGLTSTSVSSYSNTLQCIADSGGTGNRHFFNGNTTTGTPKGFPTSDPPAAGFCSTSNPCDGPGPILPQNKQQVLQALENILNLIQSQATAFASAAVPSIQSNVQNKAILTSFIPLNQPIWPGRVDAYSLPVPTHTVQLTLPDGSVTTQPVPDPSQQCTTPGQQGCHLWNAGDQILAQGLAGFDTASNSPTKRRIYYAPYTPIVAGERRLFFQMPTVTDTAHLYDLEAALGICGQQYTFTNGLPVDEPGWGTTTPCPTQTTTSSQYTTAKQAVTFTESIKTYLDQTTNQPVQYLLGDIFHSDPQVLGEPVNTTLFEGNIDGYTNFATAERYRRKVLLFGSNDGELHAVDAGTVNQGTIAGQPAWTFNNGTGNEIFAFVPRTVMPTLNAIAATAALGGGSETFMVDGPPTLAEGYFDATGGTSLQWHSLVIGGLREGGNAYYAVDVTQPDTLTSNFSTPLDSSTPTIQLPDPTATGYLPNCLNGGGSCAQLPYGTPLWEFTDSCKVVTTCTSNCALQPCDEDAAAPGKGQPDLGQAWSRPETGRVRICDSSSCSSFHEQWVVIFGGGMDPNSNNAQGNYLYMLDMNTGAVIYKRPLNGSVPSEVAAVDTGQDGYIDTIYVGTTAGHLYKVDLTSAAPLVAMTGIGTRVNTTFWKPFEIFDTEGRQMFYPPAVFFIPSINQYGLAWGTGNRQDLWKTDTTTGRFYVLVDNGLQSTTTGLPLKAANLLAINPDDGQVGSAINLLSAPATGMHGGYYLQLAAGERVVDEAFALSGVLVFSSYQPALLTSATSSNTVCADSGDTRVFLLNITNGNSLSSDTGTLGTGTPASTTGSGPAGAPTTGPTGPGFGGPGGTFTGTGGTIPANNYSNRYFVLKTDLGLNVNTAESTAIVSTKTNPNPTEPAGSAITTAVADMMTQVSKLMPSNCRFTTKRINISVTDTYDVTHQAGAVPVCVIEKNWKEF
jgi:Tfp pilus tip-associated adhesin PilY1